MKSQEAGRGAAIDRAYDRPMRARDLRRAGVLSLLAFLAVLTPASIAPAAEDAEALAADLEELRTCVRQNFPKQSSIQEVKLRVEDRGGSTRDLDAKIWWNRLKAKRSRALIRVLAPEDVRGSSVLMIERDGGSDLFLYSPEMRKTRRITTHTLAGSLFGSDFTYEDFQNLQGLAMDGAAKRLPASIVDGREVDGFEQRPAPGSGSQYERVVTYVTREGCIPFKSEMFESGGALRKVMTASVDELIEEAGVKIPRRIRMEDKLGGTSTVLEIGSAQMNVKIKRRVFDLTSLERASD
jgi:hypothetical protein